MRNHLRDPASADERGYRTPGLGHFLEVLAQDKEFEDELLSRALPPASDDPRPATSARLREAAGVSKTYPSQPGV